MKNGLKTFLVMAGAIMVISLGMWVLSTYGQTISTTLSTLFDSRKDDYQSSVSSSILPKIQLKPRKQIMGCEMPLQLLKGKSMDEIVEIFGTPTHTEIGETIRGIDCWAFKSFDLKKAPDYLNFVLGGHEDEVIKWRYRHSDDQFTEFFFAKKSKKLLAMTIRDWKRTCVVEDFLKDNKNMDKKIEKKEGRYNYIITAQINEFYKIVLTATPPDSCFGRVFNPNTGLYEKTSDYSGWKNFPVRKYEEIYKPYIVTGHEACCYGLYFK